MPISRRGLLAGAVGAAACAGIAAVAGISPEDVTVLTAADFRTGTGERRTVALPDGSSVEMDAETAIAVDNGPNLRRVGLLAGRATFTVAPDPAKPFDVACAEGTVRALGTAFTVHKRPRDTVVAVERHSVDVCLGAPGGGGDAVRLVEGERVTYGKDRMGLPVPDDGAESAWRRGRLVFRDRPLADVVADLNRYRPGRVVVWGDGLAALRVDGAFNIQDPDAVLNAIVRTLPVREARITPYLVVLSAA
jgi:transmembrane sensor